MNIFRYVGNAIGGVNYTPTNSAIDVVVIEQPDGSLCGSPFHVNFGFSLGYLTEFWLLNYSYGAIIFH